MPAHMPAGGRGGVEGKGERKSEAGSIMPRTEPIVGLDPLIQRSC